MLTILIDDLAFVEADAIARPVNGSLGAATPIMRRLEQAAGPLLPPRSAQAEPLEVGAAVVSGGGRLAAGLVIHAVVVTDDEAVSRDGVRRATLSALQRASDWKADHVAFAPFGLGAGNLDAESAAAAMRAAVRAHRERSPRPARLTFVVENALEEEAFRLAFADDRSPA